MKLTLKKFNSLRSEDYSNVFLQPMVMLEHQPKKEYMDGEQLIFKLQSVPHDKNLTTYELSVLVFKSGLPEELLT